MTLDIVIPARNEAATIGGTLAAILADASALTLSVVIALNGEDQQATHAAAAPFVDAFAEGGHRLDIIAVSAAGKPAALNAGDARRSGGAVLYCDADAVFWPGSLPALARALEGEAPRLVGPRREVIPPKHPIARGFSAVWQALPQVQSFIGAGCYGVNAAGRARWGAFPDLVADDAFVFSRFAANERIIPPEAAIWFAMPEGTDLLRAVARWREGNAQLQGREDHVAPSLPSWGWLARDPALIRHLPSFLLVKYASYLTGSAVTGSGWSPQRRRRPE